MTNLLADTHILLWSMREPHRLPKWLRETLASAQEPLFSVISIWEIAIKANLKRADFLIDARRARATLLRDGWRELEFTGEHAIVAGGLPLLHGDPFDRALVAQASVEKVELVTSDRRLGAYGEPVRVI
jgi:PIN domain nuclease of toxin-antitoxin system